MFITTAVTLTAVLSSNYLEPLHLLIPVSTGHVVRNIALCTFPQAACLAKELRTLLDFVTRLCTKQGMFNSSTFISCVLFVCFFSEFVNLSWMKPDKNERAPNILRVTKRFNEVSVLFSMYYKNVSLTFFKLQSIPTQSIYGQRQPGQF